MKVYLKTAALVSFLFILALSLSLKTATAQGDPLSLVEVATALQSKSSGMTLVQKNTYLITRIQDRGVTFRLTPEIEKELRSAGANAALINAIRLNSAATTATPTPAPVRIGTKPVVNFDKLWVDYNVTEDDRKGLRIHTKFSVSNMLNIPGYLAVYFEKKNGDLLKTTNKQYSSNDGQVAVYRKITPGYSPAVYNDFAVFIPYSEFNLPYGDFDLKLDADLIYENGEMIQHLEIFDFVFKNPKPVESTSDEIITFDKMWVDYNITENRKLGMRVHVKLNIKNMVGIETYIAVYFEKQNGDKLYSDNDLFRSKGGQTAVYKSFNPPYKSSDYNDVQLFIPYDEFNLQKGVHDLRIHSDLIYPGGELIKHLNYYNFQYTKN